MSNKQPSLSDFKRAYIQASHIVAKHGEKYLPIFERVEREYALQLEQKETLTRAIKISKSNDIE